MISINKNYLKGIKLGDFLPFLQNFVPAKNFKTTKSWNKYPRNIKYMPILRFSFSYFLIKVWYYIE